MPGNLYVCMQRTFDARVDNNIIPSSSSLVCHLNSFGTQKSCALIRLVSLGLYACVCLSPRQLFVVRGALWGLSWMGCKHSVYVSFIYLWKSTQLRKSTSEVRVARRELPSLGSKTSFQSKRCFKLCMEGRAPHRDSGGICQTAGVVKKSQTPAPKSFLHV